MRRLRDLPVSAPERRFNHCVYSLGEEHPMAMTSLEARKILANLETLIAVIEERSGALDRDDLLALRSLRHRRSSLRGLLAVREIERAKKIVHLELWRDGCIRPRKAAASA
jgi:hypothetical protein